MRNRKGSAKAKELLEEIGIEEITDIPMKKIVSSLGAIYMEEPLSNSDGKIVRGKKKTLIIVNSNILYEEKKRFTIAHEIGHLLLHDKLDLEVHNENSNTLNWFKNTEKQAKRGRQEWEANDFASELLMPEKLFRKISERRPFSPELVKELSQRFKASITSIVYRILTLDIYPLFIVNIHKGKVKYWSKSNDLWVKVKENTTQNPPDDSVALEYLESGYEYLYKGKDKAQEISKSTWFELRENEDDSDFYEYCIPTKQYENIISVVWQE